MKRILYPKGTEVTIINNIVQVTIPFNKFSKEEVEELKKNAETLRNILETGLHMMYEKIRLISIDRSRSYWIKSETLKVEILGDSVIHKAEMANV